MRDPAFTVPAGKLDRLTDLYGYDAAGDSLIALAGAPEEQIHDYTKPPNVESGGGGLVSTASDYARFAQMLANGGELDGARILAPATVKLIGTNAIPPAALGLPNGNRINFGDAIGYGLGVMVVSDPLKAGSIEGPGDDELGRRG